MLSVLVVDHCPTFVRGLQANLAEAADIELITLPSENHQLAQSCRLMNPDLLLLNAHLPGLQLPELLVELSHGCPTTHLLLLLDPGMERTLDLQFLLQNRGGNRHYFHQRAISGVGHGHPHSGCWRWLVQRNSWPPPVASRGPPTPDPVDQARSGCANPPNLGLEQPSHCRGATDQATHGGNSHHPHSAQAPA